MGKKILFVVNPHAGRGEIRGKVLDVIELFTRAGHTVTVHPTTGKGDIVALLPPLEGQYDMVLVSGGDGTINEAVSGLMQMQDRPLLAYIPAGTVNDTATNLSLPRNILRAAEVAVKGRAIPLDISNFNGQWYVYVAAFGIFSDVAYATPQQHKNLLGRLAYLMQGVRSLSDVRTYHVRVKTPVTEFEDDVIFGMVCSTTSVGGFSPSPRSLRERISLSDGLSEVILVKRPKTLTEFSNMAADLLRLDLSGKYFHFLQTDRVEFTFPERVPWTLDGEFGGSVQSATVVNHPGAVQICSAIEQEPGKEE